MRKFSLTEFAAIAEVVATIGVIVSLVLVSQSMNNNANEVRASQINSIYDHTRQIGLLVAPDPEWVRIVLEGRDDIGRLSDVDRYRYDAYLISMLDL